MTLRYVNSALDFRVVNLAGDWRLVNSVSRLPPDYPETPAPIAATVSSISPTYVSVTNSLRRQVRSRGAQAWGIELVYGAMTRATFAPLWAFLNKQAGQSGQFTVNIPGLRTPRGAATGTPLIAGGGQSGTSILTDGWANSTVVLKKGDFVEFDGDKKIYQITEDITSSGAGAATLTIFPSVRKSPSDNVTVHTDVVFTCALTSDVLEADFDQCINGRGFSVSLIEVLK